MDETLIKSSSTLFGSLFGYQLAKNNPFIDRVPAMLIGGFIGSIMGDQISKSFTKTKRTK